ncbi:hypothetical protein ABZS66_19140 [Dactylosporangium sp. NPDC005572]|uniref:hypothetical protein n=1 Tax=Dactylosporangium sp. NPDC005572 TaxID=3156889 RepID=UPI0033A8CB0B
MPRRMLVVTRGTEPQALLKLEVLNADMPHPGWMRFELQASAPDWEEPTICWYRVPDGASVELQSEVTDADVMARLAEQPEDRSTRRRLTLGRLQLYVEPRDAWIGVYVAPQAVYVLPLPFIVLRWTRAAKLSEGSDRRA